MNYDVFISYSRKDTKVADAICAALTEAGISFFIDKEGIIAGADFPEVLANTIDSATVFLLVASDNAYKSKFTKAEILYAFNHKRSGCIIPYLIDDTPMPADLEFLLGNMNWMYSSKCPVSAIPAEVRKALDNPESGTIGGRKVHKKWVTWVIIGVILAAVGVVAAMTLKDRKQDIQKQEVENAAVADYQDYDMYIQQSDSLVSAAGYLSRQPNTVETTTEQITDLQDASALLTRADSLKYKQSQIHQAMFNADLASRQRVIKAKLDSMHTAWAEYAVDSWQLYRITRSKSDAQSTLECIDHALSIHSNPELESIKKQLTK